MDFVVVCISMKWRTAGNDTGYSTLENICIARSFRGNVSYPKPVQLLNGHLAMSMWTFFL